MQQIPNFVISYRCRSSLRANFRDSCFVETGLKFVDCSCYSWAAVVKTTYPQKHFAEVAQLHRKTRRPKWQLSAMCCTSQNFGCMLLQFMLGQISRQASGLPEWQSLVVFCRKQGAAASGPSQIFQRMYQVNMRKGREDRIF